MSVLLYTSLENTEKLHLFFSAFMFDVVIMEMPGRRSPYIYFILIECSGDVLYSVSRFLQKKTD